MCVCSLDPECGERELDGERGGLGVMSIVTFGRMISRIVTRDTIASGASILHL